MVLEKIAVLKELTIFSVLLRTVLAMVFSGILGYEREKKGRPAGFRTYMVVCIGSEIAMMTGIFLSREPDCCAGDQRDRISGSRDDPGDPAEPGKGADHRSGAVGRCLSGTGTWFWLLLRSNCRLRSHLVFSENPEHSR